LLIRTLTSIDARLFNGSLRRFCGRMLYGMRSRRVKPEFAYSYLVRYDKNASGYLAGLCDTYGSDKGELSSEGNPYTWPSHTCADFYASLFDHCRLEVRRVFECGIGTNNPDLPSSMGKDGKPGASLRVWRDYFPNAQIIGADIDRQILFEEDRISTYFVDQTNPESIHEFWTKCGYEDFDVMIDDGLHTFDAAVSLFEHSIDKLAPRGVYIIEDVISRYVPSFRHYFLGRGYHVEFVELSGPKVALQGNRLIVIRNS